MVGRLCVQQCYAHGSKCNRDIWEGMHVVPVWFTQRERQALMDAAELAGINVLSLMNDHTACTSWAPAR